MNFRKNSILIVGGSVGGVLLILAVFLLFSSSGRYHGNVTAFNSAKNRLNALNTRKAFPSAENTALASENLAQMKSKYADLRASLMAAQLQADQIEPARFAPMMEDSIRRVRAAIQEIKSNKGHETKLPAETELGFKDYAAGKLPPNDTNTMRRLVLQVKGLETLIGLAVSAQVDSVDGLLRDDFELRSAAAPVEEETGFRGRGRGRVEEQPVQVAEAVVGGFPLPTENPMYEVERFVIEVTGAEYSIWDFINRLAASPVQFSVADISFKNTRANPGRPVDFKGAVSKKRDEMIRTLGEQAASREIVPGDLSADERIAGGREPVKARLVVDMILLKEEGEGAQP